MQHGRAKKINTIHVFMFFAVFIHVSGIYYLGSGSKDIESNHKLWNDCLKRAKDHCPIAKLMNEKEELYTNK